MLIHSAADPEQTNIWRQEKCFLFAPYTNLKDLKI